MAKDWVIFMSVTLTICQFGLVYSETEDHDEKLEIRKCCPTNQVWDVRNSSCESVKSGEEFPGPLKKLIRWSPQEDYEVIEGNTCPEGTLLQFLNPRDPLQDYAEVNDGIFMTNKTVLLNSNQFCLDRVDTQHKLIVMACLEPSWTQSHSSHPKIHVNKCCAQGLSYVAPTGNSTNPSCEPAATNAWSPPGVVNSKREILQVFKEDWQISYEFPKCSTDEELFYYSVEDVTDQTSRITLFDDGQLYVRKFNALHNQSKFCMDDTTQDNVKHTMVQVCYKNPCKNKTCIRRCCPEGFVMNVTSYACDVPTSDPLNALEIKDANGNLIEPSNITTHYIHDNKPVCMGSMNWLNPSETQDDSFYITQSGNIYVPFYKKKDAEIEDYCVDYFGENSLSKQINALICFPVVKEDSEDVKMALAVYPYFMLFSSVFLFATFFVYAILPELQNLHGMTIMCHVFSLLITYLCLGIVQLTGGEQSFCVTIAVIIHFFFLSAFTWMGTMGFDLFWTFRYGSGEDQHFWNNILSGSPPEVIPMKPLKESVSVSSSSTETVDATTTPNPNAKQTGGMRVRRAGQERHVRRFIKYSVFAWGVPFIIVTIGQILDHIRDLPDWVITPEFGIEKCWFAERAGKLAILCYFYGPIAVILFCNLIFFISTAIRLYHANKDSNMATRNSRAKQRFRVVLSVSVLMGVTWVLEVISWAVGGENYYWMPTDILNILQAVLIFVIFVCKQKVVRLLYRRCLPLLNAWRSIAPECMACYCCDKYATRDTSTIRGSTSNRRKISGSATTVQTHVRESSLERDTVDKSVITLNNISSS